MNVYQRKTSDPLLTGIPHEPTVPFQKRGTGSSLCRRNAERPIPRGNKYMNCINTCYILIYGRASTIRGMEPDLQENI